jgi:ATP-dependent DNA ligase
VAVAAAAHEPKMARQTCGPRPKIYHPRNKRCVTAFFPKLDGYRAIAFKSNGRVHLRSRNNKDFAVRYPAIASALKNLPDETVIDGEVVAFDDSGRPSFNTLQNFGSSTVPIFFYAFDLLILGGLDVKFEALERRRELLRTKVLSKLHEPIRYSLWAKYRTFW